MPIKFEPIFNLTTNITRGLMSIEAAKEKILHLPVTAAVLASLRETARLDSTHYSTMIEGNRLTQEQVEEVVLHKGHFTGRERDEREIKGYYEALRYVDQVVAKDEVISEAIIKKIHGLVVGSGRTRIAPTGYRDGQNVIRDSATKRIIYLPPEASDVPGLMQALIKWVNHEQEMRKRITIF